MVRRVHLVLHVGKLHGGERGYAWVRTPVSYTHLDVYKRQIQAYWIEKPKQGEGDEKIFCVWKDKCPPVGEQNPDGRRGKYVDRQSLENN